MTPNPPSKLETSLDAIFGSEAADRGCRELAIDIFGTDDLSQESAPRADAIDVTSRSREAFCDLDVADHGGE